MTEAKIKQQLLELIKTYVEEQEVLPIEFMVDGIPNACCAYQHFLARYHVRTVAKTLTDIHYYRAIDPELELEITACIDSGVVMAQPDSNIRIDWLVNSIFAAHSVRCPEFDELVDPVWLVSIALGGIRHLIQDVLDENTDPGHLKAAYIVTRNGEDFLVPSGLLTIAEMEAILDAERVVQRWYRATVEEASERQADASNSSPRPISQEMRSQLRNTDLNQKSTKKGGAN
jgi:hypothetical protein